LKYLTFALHSPYDGARIAKHMTTQPAVMSAIEEIEFLLAVLTFVDFVIRDLN